MLQPTISQDLRLRSSGEQLGVEELIPETVVEGFRESVFPGRVRRDVSRACGPKPNPRLSE
jgi:aspartate ammonia-lyase